MASNNVVRLRLDTTPAIKQLLDRMVVEDRYRLRRKISMRQVVEQALIRDARRRYPKLAKSLLGGGR